LEWWRRGRGERRICGKQRYAMFALSAGETPLTLPVNARFDPDIVAWFKSQGRGY